MKTIRDYYFTEAFTGTSRVLKLVPSEVGGLVVLDRTLFVPQGGGQPTDVGTIGHAQVVHVEAPKETPEIIVHTVSSLDGLIEGSEVETKVDVPRRQLHSRLHSGGHLIAALVEEILPGAKACGGHHWPGEGRVEFIFTGHLPDEFEHAVADALSEAIASDLTVLPTLSQDGERFVQIGSYPALRCGGTHCWRLQNIGSITLRGIKQKKDRLRIGYDVTAASQAERIA